jgi:hypothetical protein
MEHFITFVTVVGGIIFSVAVAVVVEEFIFGQIFKVFFAPPKPAAPRPGLANWTAQQVSMNRVGMNQVRMNQVTMNQVAPR